LPHNHLYFRRTWYTESQVSVHSVTSIANINK